MCSRCDVYRVQQKHQKYFPRTSISANFNSCKHDGGTYAQKLNGEMQLCKEVITAWRWLLKEGRSKLDDEIEQDYKVEHNANMYVSTVMTFVWAITVYTRDDL